MATALDLQRTYSSYAGVDIKVVMAGTVVGEMQAISYAIQREKAPIYVMGKVDPISFSRGKRGIAGTMISLLLDSHLLHTHKGWNDSNFVADKGEVMSGMTIKKDASSFANDFTGGDPKAVNTDIFGESHELKAPQYVDQILPFDVTIVAANEYGQASAMRIYGCEILNEGSGFSIDDIVIENQMTYVCRTVMPWKKMGEWGLDAAKGKLSAFVYKG